MMMNNEDPIRFMFPAAQAPFLQILHRAAPHLLRQPQFLAAGGAATAALGGFDAQRMHRAPRQRRRHDRNGRCFGRCFRPFLVVNLVILRGWWCVDVFCCIIITLFMDLADFLLLQKLLRNGSEKGSPILWGLGVWLLVPGEGWLVIGNGMLV